jgi:two-component system NtrC family sensor kinase
MIDQVIIPLEPSEGDMSSLPQPDSGLVRAILDSIPARVAVLDRELRYIYGNRSLLQFLGVSKAGIIGCNIVAVLGEKAFEEFKPYVTRALGGETVSRSEWITYPGSRERYVQQVVTPYRANDHTIAGLFIFTRDLTDLKLHEQQLAQQIEALRASKAVHAAVVETSLDCVIVVNEDDCIVEFNPAATATFGYTREEALGRSIAELIIPLEFRDRHMQAMRRYLVTSEGTMLGRRVELEALCKDGRRIPIEIAITEVTLPGQRLFTAHLRDLTEARQAAAEIERQRDALYQSEKLAAMGSLLAGVAHELNNPLAIVLGQAHMLQETVKTLPPDNMGQTLSERALKIENAAERCAKIVRSFLAIARQRKVEKREVQLGPLLNEALDLLSYTLRSASINVTCDIASDLPNVRADPDQIHQVAVNLLVNARQALEEIEGPRRINITARLDGNRRGVTISISDSGHGIPAHLRNRIFDPFFTTKAHDKGTGIGLPVSRGFIEGNGGRLTLAPRKEGEGACFVIWLPVENLAAKVAHSSSSAVVEDKDLQGSALIVDDEAELASVMADILASRGMRSDIVLNGRDALTKLLASPNAYDIILCDLQMPKMAGPALFRHLKSKQPHLTKQIAFVTGDTLGSSASQFLAEAGCPIIEKPFRPEEVWRVVRQLRGVS